MNITEEQIKQSHDSIVQVDLYRAELVTVICVFKGADLEGMQKFW